MTKVVLDTSVIINAQITAYVESGNLRNCQLVIPQAVVDELQSQAAQKKEQGFVGLKEIQNLKNISKNFGLEISIEGAHPSLEDIQLAGKGKIDSIIMDIARQEEATLYTSDNVQNLVAQAEGITSVYLHPEIKEEDLEFLKYFDSETMSVHLKENLHPLAKRGHPGHFELAKISDEILTRDQLEFMAKQIIETPITSDSSTAEITKKGADVIQYKDYRIAITKPPFSESFEITIVHPIVKLSLDDYSISPELMDRFADRAEGIVISGPPGSGKSTLASGLANFYHSQGKIVKTFESPRDLQVDAGITQYSKLDGSFDNTADILLLVRPDYTIFDEVRRREDFHTFADLRLTGVGMVGVVHANSPLDAIQRFIGKIELGIIPNVLDTVVFVKDGKIEKVYDLELKVKVPTGMTESDLARPVIEIRNFENNALEHEIYTFGEENVIVPIGQKAKKVGIEKLAEDKIRDTFRRYDPDAQVEIISDNRVKVLVDQSAIPSIIGRGGSNISDIEKQLNIHIDVVERGTSGHSMSGELPFSFSESKTAVVLTVSREYNTMHADIFVNDKYVTTQRIGKKGHIKIPRRSDAAKNLMQLATSQNDIHIYLKDF
ncbi:MAG: ATPase [Nitrososphaeria archaeon]|nr:ATPase [Nitrosopumilaceae archaeon]NIP10137.1 ATPase [Nitrosopumilaceae archaeon]NIP91501.1 ATPase [Nitrososphaeria archaeon]NIS95336.1 ATPase [Nitrosopumilaceae archaeon]